MWHNIHAQPFNGPLSKTTRAGTRRNIHPLTPILIIGHLLSTSSIYYDPQHPPCLICMLHSPFPQPLSRSSLVYLAYTHTHTRLTALFPGLPRWAGTRKVKPIWILLKQETVTGSGISWAMCKSAPRSRQITTPAHHHSKFFTGRMPFLTPNQQCQSTEGVPDIPVHKIILESISTFKHHCKGIEQALDIWNPQSILLF